MKDKQLQVLAVDDDLNILSLIKFTLELSKEGRNCRAEGAECTAASTLISNPSRSAAEGQLFGQSLNSDQTHSVF